MVKHAKYLQLCDQLGRPIDKKVATEQVFLQGYLHLSAHVWLWRKSDDGIEILLQRRALDKKSWPGYWDISAAGHVDYGESIEDAALRETREEIGYKIDIDRLELAFVHRCDVRVPDTQHIENEYRSVYLCEFTGDTELCFSDGEVSEVKWVSLDLFIDMTKDPLVYNLVNHRPSYFALLIEQLQVKQGPSSQ